MWQRMTEPEFDHGFSTTYGVLFDKALGGVGWRSPQSLEAELAEHLGDSEWAALKASVLEGSGRSADDDNWQVLVTAVWAEHLAEPLSVVWLAAMAQHAYYIAYDDFAFGYLTALLDQRLKNEGHFERGARAVESAALGGQTRASEHRRKRAMIFPEMARLVSKGHSVSRAAELAFQAGHGTSAEANRRLWVRHAKHA